MNLVDVPTADVLNSGFLPPTENKMDQKLHQSNLLVAVIDNKLSNGTSVGKIDTAHPDHDAVAGT